MTAVVLDVDTGIDDALAIVFAARHPDIELRAITCVSGNTDLDNVVANTLTTLDVLGLVDVPVAAGGRQPLIEERRSASWAHGPHGLADIQRRTGGRRVDRRHAVELLRETVESDPGRVTLVALAPLTNVALFVRMYPAVAAKIERIVFMGGTASAGNATAVAEFNIWHDPEAAHIVLNSGVPLTMYGLDVFNKVSLSEEQIAELAGADTPVEQFVGRLLGFSLLDPVRGDRFPLAKIGDAGALCALVSPELYTFARLPAQVELAVGHSRGQVLVDQRTRGGEDAVHRPNRAPWPNLDVALGVQAGDVTDLFLTAIRPAPQSTTES